jgi:hypothetical protein
MDGEDETVGEEMDERDQRAGWKRKRRHGVHRIPFPPPTYFNLNVSADGRYMLRGELSISHGHFSRRHCVHVTSISFNFSPKANDTFNK